MDSSTPLKPGASDSVESFKSNCGESPIVKLESVTPDQLQSAERSEDMVMANIKVEVEKSSDTIGGTEENANIQDTSDSIKEDIVKLEEKKNETIDVLCLQLDESDNLELYLEKERAKKKELLKNNDIKREGGKQTEKFEIKKPLFRKVKAVKRLRATSKKKIIKVAVKKVKSKIEKVDTLEEKSKEVDVKQEPKTDVLTYQKAEIEKDQSSADKADPIDAVKEHPEVTVKSVVVKCDKPEKDHKVESRFLWVSNITRNTKANDLKIHFTPHGKVQTARIVTDGQNYYGYLVMEKREDVDNCIKHLDGTLFEENKIHLSEKGPRERKSPSKEVSERTKEGKELSKDRSRKSSRHSSKSNDPLTLRVGEKREDDRNKVQPGRIFRDRKSEERREMIRRNREAERIKEERRKERIKYEERKAQEMKIEREKRKLEHERHLIEKERISLLRLQKRLADTERLLIQRQKQELERDIKHLEYKKHKSSDNYERKSKAPRIEENRSKDYWKEHRPSPKKYEENFKKDPILAPPPPVLTENYHQKSEKERPWEPKKEFPERIKEQDSTRYTYDRNDYSDRYPKDRYKEKEKTYNWQNYSSSGGGGGGGGDSWRIEQPRNIPRHTMQFPVTPNLYGEIPATSGYYQASGYRKANDYYYRGPERKY